MEMKLSYVRHSGASVHSGAVIGMTCSTDLWVEVSLEATKVRTTRSACRLLLIKRLASNSVLSIGKSSSGTWTRLLNTTLMPSSSVKEEISLWSSRWNMQCSKPYTTE